MQKHIFGVLLYVCLVWAVSAPAKVYWLPDYLHENLDRNDHRVNEPDEGSGGSNPGGSGGACSAWGWLDATQKGNMECAGYETIPGGITCYKNCSCPSKYQYTSSNCSGDKKPSGNICDGKYDQCLCNSQFQYDSQNCKDGQMPDGNFCTDSTGKEFADSCISVCPSGQYHESQIADLLNQNYYCSETSSSCYTCTLKRCDSSHSVTESSCTSPNILGGNLCTEVDGTVYATDCVCPSGYYSSDTCRSPKILSGDYCTDLAGNDYQSQCNCPSGMIEQSEVSAKEAAGYNCTNAGEGCYTCTAVECDGSEGWTLLAGTNQCAAIPCSSGYATAASECGTAEANGTWSLGTATSGKSAGKVCKECIVSCNSGYINLDTYWCDGALRCTWK